MSKKKTTGGIVAGFGVILFAFGFYILPFGTDIYLHFWVVNVFHGNWLYGSLAGNIFALILIGVGLALMHDRKTTTKEEDDDMDVIIIRPKKGGKKR